MDDPEKDRHESFEDSGVGIGQTADGRIESFPASELPARTAQRDSEDAATAYAMEQSEEGFPEPADQTPEDDDLSDLDDLDALLAEKPEAP